MKPWHAIVLATALAALATPVSAQQIIAPADVNVRVHFQCKSPTSNQWSSASSTTRGAVTEDMMANQLSSRYGGREVRILSASVGGKTRRVYVTYSVIRKNSRSRGSSTLTNALTPSMAENQIKARYPDADVKLLSIQQR